MKQREDIIVFLFSSTLTTTFYSLGARASLPELWVGVLGCRTCVAPKG